MSELGVDLAVSFGECALTLAFEGHTVSINNHWLNDRLTELVSGVNALLDGTESVSCRWQGPVSEGHFVDLVADPEGGVSVVVHAFRYPAGTTFAEIWSAERGESIFQAHLPLADFVIPFTTALRRVRSTSVDAAGVLREYPRAFPSSELERLERRATRFGYRPQSLAEIEGRPDSTEE